MQLDAIVEPMLRECDYGRWSGRPFDEVQAQEPEAMAEWLRDPEAAPHGGESIVGLIGRVAAWLETQNGMRGKTVAVTHASVIRAAIVHAIETNPRSFWRIDVAPLSVTALSGNAARWTLSAIGPLMWPSTDPAHVNGSAIPTAQMMTVVVMSAGLARLSTNGILAVLMTDYSRH